MADPQSLLVADAAARAVEFVGMPEARLNLAQAVIHLALAPKSNSVIAGIGAAIEDVRDRPAGAVPVHLRDASYPGAGKLGHGEGYVYPHDAPAGWVPQQYRPADVEARVYYRPGAQGHEAELGELLERRRTRREAEGEHADEGDGRDDVGDPSEGA
jgi:putative ATPase